MVGFEQRESISWWGVDKEGRLVLFVSLGMGTFPGEGEEGRKERKVVDEKKKESADSGGLGRISLIYVGTRPSLPAFWFFFFFPFFWRNSVRPNKISGFPFLTRTLIGLFPSTLHCTL